MSPQVYPAYEPSDIEWLGEIPEHWELKRVKMLGRIKYGLSQPPRALDTGLPFIRATDISSGKISLAAVQRVDPDDVPWSRDPLLQTSDILVVRSGAYTGDSAIVPPEVAGAIAGYDLVLRVTKALPHFVAYTLLSKYVLQGQIYRETMRAAQPHLNAEELGNCRILLPPKPEQEAIINSLDRETARIDALIKMKLRQIELLNEKRIALISHVVTNGLDPGAKMGPSDIEWLGEIPEHWELKRVKMLGRIKYGLSQPPRALDTGLPFIRATDISSGKISLAAVQRVDPDDVPWSRDPLLQTNDILVVRSGYAGDSAIVPPEVAGAIAGYDMVLRVTKECPNFVAYALLSKYVLQGQIYRETMRAAQPHLNAEELGNCRILLPPKPDQEQVVLYLDKHAAYLDKILTKINMSITTLREYRTTRISAAVTGTIDVCEDLT